MKGLRAARIPGGRLPVISAIVLALSAVVLLVGMLWATGGMSGGGYGDESVRARIEAVVVAVIFLSVNAAPLVAGSGVALWAGRVWPRGQVAFTVGSVAIAVFTATAVRGVLTSDSSTAVLEFLFLPMVLWALLGAAVGATALLDHLVRRLSSPPRDVPAPFPDASR